VIFADPDALKGSLINTLKAVRPTVFFGVPRVWEKFADAMKAKAPKPTSFKGKVAKFAKSCAAAKYAAAADEKKDPNSFFARQISGAVVGKIKEALGLDRVKFFGTGAAPISVDVLKYFGSLDINILELFGMSEATGPTNLSTQKSFTVGKCGAAMPGTETMCDDKAGGEICFRGRNIMMGYMYNDEATKKTIDDDGWLRSGDVGTLDDRGHLKITGRIKELIITAGGENVAPVLIEDAIKKHLPCVSNAMVVGDQRKFLAVLLTLKVAMTDDGASTDALVGPAKLEGCTTVAEAKASEAYQKILDDGLKAANKDAISRAQCVQKFVLLDDDFTQDGGELTPTMKLKRAVTVKKHAAAIDGLYA